MKGNGCYGGRVMRLIISSCLVGLNTRYDGKNNSSEVFTKLIKTGNIVPFCPEQAGGLCTQGHRQK